MNLDERPVSSEQIFDGKVLKLFVDQITLPDGKPAVREVIRHVGAVCVIPLTDEGEVICVKQYRYPIERVTLEIPAGKLESKDEDPREAALRELREETGAHCRDLIFLGELYTSPAILDERIYMYFARGLTYGETDPDDDEFLDVLRVPLDEMVQMVLDGKISDAKTQIAVMKVKLLLSENI